MATSGMAKQQAQNDQGRGADDHIDNSFCGQSIASQTSLNQKFYGNTYRADTTRGSHEYITPKHESKENTPQMKTDDEDQDVEDTVPSHRIQSIFSAQIENEIHLQHQMNPDDDGQAANFNNSAPNQINAKKQKSSTHIPQVPGQCSDQNMQYKLYQQYLQSQSNQVKRPGPVWASQQQTAACSNTNSNSNPNQQQQ